MWCGEFETKMRPTHSMMMWHFQHFYAEETAVAGHIARMDDPRIPKKVMGGRRPVTKPRGRWEDAVDLPQIQNWKAAARNSEGWRQKMGRPWPENEPKRQRRRRRKEEIISCKDNIQTDTVENGWNEVS